MWTQAQAVALCRAVEAICPMYGCHVALTGGLLYKDGPRKDCDLLFYRVRQVEKIEVDAMFHALEAVGIVRVTKTLSFCIKAKHADGDIDCFFPEVESGNYEADEDAKPSRPPPLPSADDWQF